MVSYGLSTGVKSIDEGYKHYSLSGRIKVECRTRFHQAFTGTFNLDNSNDLFFIVSGEPWGVIYRKGNTVTIITKYEASIDVYIFSTSGERGVAGNYGVVVSNSHGETVFDSRRRYLRIIKVLSSKDGDRMSFGERLIGLMPIGQIKMTNEFIAQPWDDGYANFRTIWEADFVRTLSGNVEINKYKIYSDSSIAPDDIYTIDKSNIYMESEDSGVGAYLVADLTNMT